MAAKKSSLVANINRRKKRGTSRSKSRSTISPEAYEAMERGWPKRSRKTAKKKASASPARRRNLAPARKLLQAG